MSAVTVIIVGTDGIDRSTDLPLWVELARQLREQIEDGRLHGRLDSEMDMAAHWRVSKTVVRKALRELRRLGLIVTYHGHGSVVVPPEDRPQM